MTIEELWALVEQAEQIGIHRRSHTMVRREELFQPPETVYTNWWSGWKSYFAGDLAQFREYLLWGELTHIGKSQRERRWLVSYRHVDT